MCTQQFEHYVCNGTEYHVEIIYFVLICALQWHMYVIILQEKDGKP